VSKATAGETIPHNSYRDRVANHSFIFGRYSVQISAYWLVILNEYISTIRIEFCQVQQCFSNKIKPLHVSANDGRHQKATNTSKEMLHMCCYMHVVLYGLH
jgi:hypothetical protein